MTAQIIFIHGASSSGKSTIARQLQAEIELPFWHISFDHLRDSGVLPSARFASKEFDWSEVRPKFFSAFHQSLAAYAGAGNNLIVEHILDTEGWLDVLRTLLAPFDVYFVGVHCPLPLLVERELARGNRPVGSARQDFETIHVGRRYDLEVSSENGVEANIAAILAGWRSGKRASDFTD